MAFPSVSSSRPASGGDANGGAATNGATAANSHVVTLPVTVNAGDLLLVAGRCAGAGAIAVTGGGWTITQSSADGSDDVTFWMYRNALADGSEDSATITVTHGATLKFACVALAIAGAADPATQAPQGATAIGTMTVVDPPSLTPTGGAKDYLWLPLFAFDGEQGTTPGNGIPSGTIPANYTQIAGGGTGSAGVAAVNCQAAMAYRQLNAASENPGSWTTGAGTSNWEAYTIAVHPAGAAPKSLLAQRRLNPNVRR